MLGMLFGTQYVVCASALQVNSQAEYDNYDRIFPTALTESYTSMMNIGVL